MNLVIYKYYDDLNKLKFDMDNNANNNDRTISYLSGQEDIFAVLKELIKTEYPV